MNINGDFYLGISNSIYENYYFCITYVGIMAGYNEKDDCIYFPPKGIWKMTSSQFLTMLTNFYGLERGQDIFQLRQKLTMVFCKYSEYQLALIIIKSIIMLAISSEKFAKTMPTFAKVLVSTLNRHLDQMLHTAGLTSVSTLFLELLRKDYVRIISSRYNIKSMDTVDVDK